MRRIAIIAVIALVSLAATASTALASATTITYHADGSTADVYGTHDGTWSGTPAYAAGYTGGSGDESFSFNGGPSYITFDHAVGTFGTDDATISFWIQTTSQAHQQLLGDRLFCNNPGEGWWELGIRGASEPNAGEMTAEFGGQGYYTQAISTTRINDGRWHHIVVHRGTTGVWISIDGNAEAFSSGPAANISPSVPLEISHSSCGYTDNASIDELSITRGTVPAPSLSVSHSADAQNGWNGSSPVTETVTASASISDIGLASGSPKCTVDGKQAALTAGGSSGTWTFSVAGTGQHAVSCSASDNSGAQTTAGDTVKIDGTPPSISVSHTLNGNGGWSTSSPVTETVAASDAASGLAGAPVCTLDGNPVTLDGGDGSWTFSVSGDGQHPVSCQASDTAGNQGSAGDTVKVDSTPPSLTAVHQADGQNGWNVGPSVTEVVTASDSGSGLAGAPVCTLDGSPATLSGGNGSWSFQVSGDGTHAVSCSVSDSAGNSNSAADSVQVDSAAPAVSVSNQPSGSNGWNTSSPVTETVAASDGGSGLAGQPSCTDGDGNQVTLTAGSSNGTWTFQVSGDGQHPFSCSAADNAGNQGSGKDAVQIDTAAPSTSASGVPAGPVNHDVTVALNATDPSPGSGVAGTYYTVDGGSQQSGSSVSIPAPSDHSDDGTHTIAYWSVDNAGNVESKNSATVKIKTVAPAIGFGGGDANGGFAAAGAPAQVSVGDPNATITYTLDGSPYTAGSPINALGPHTLVVSACDDAGNCSQATTTFTVFAFANGGNFVLGDQTVGGLAKSTGLQVTFWGAQWARSNQLSGGSAPSSFKGFEDSRAKVACGQAWTTGPGNSSSPPSSVPAYMAVIVSSSISKSGPTISGDTQHVVIVKTAAGYGGDPSHPGTGTIVGSLC